MDGKEEEEEEEGWGRQKLGCGSRQLFMFTQISLLGTKSESETGTCHAVIVVVASLVD